jgi:hypothetical protein
LGDRLDGKNNIFSVPKFDFPEIKAVRASISKIRFDFSHSAIQK